MFLHTDSFKINSVDFGPYLISIEYGYNKLWANDTGRSMSGKTTGSLLGIVDKFKLTFKELTQAELEIVSPILNSAFQTVYYYNPDQRAFITEQTYTGDWATLNKNTFDNNLKANESFDISVIATTPRRT